MAIALSGSLILSGSITVSGSIISTGTISMSGSIASASYATNADLLDGLDSTVFTLTSSFAAQTASFTAFTASLNSFSASQNLFTASLNSFSASVLTFTGSASTRLGALESYTSSLNNKTSSFATTSSNTFEGIQTISGSVLQSGSFTSTGTLTAQTLVVQTITSSVVYSSGSNVFGNSLGNSQVFTGSVLITGSLALAGNITSNGTAVVLGSGTSSYLPKFTGTSTIGNSIVYDDGTSVGVGTIVPLQKFDVTTTAGEVISSTSNRSTNGQYISGIVSAAKNSSAAYLSYAATYGLIESNTAGSESGAYTIWTRKSGTLSEKLRLDASGNLGLGVTASAWSGITVLQIGGYASFGGDSSFVTYVSSNAYYNAGWKYIGVSAAANYYQDSGAHYFRSTSTTGTAGGAITWITPLTIASTGAATFASSVTAAGYLISGDNPLKLNSIESVQSQQIYYQNNGTTKFQLFLNTATNSFGIYNNAIGSSSFTIASTGAATFSSGIGIGGATATTGGIQFPATAVAIADANNLDDYEEGTWTPTLTTSGGTPPTVVSSSGRYIIIGKLVTIYFKFLLSSASGGSGQLKITNAPFSLNLSTIPAVGFARITDLGLTLNCGFLTGTVINFNKYDGNYAGTDYETVGQVSYYND